MRSIAIAAALAAVLTTACERVEDRTLAAVDRLAGPACGTESRALRARLLTDILADRDAASPALVDAVEAVAENVGEGGAFDAAAARFRRVFAGALVALAVEHGGDFPTRMTEPREVFAMLERVPGLAGDVAAVRAEVAAACAGAAR